MNENLNFLQRELLAKEEVIKSLVETLTAILSPLSNTSSKPVSMNSSSRNCSIETEEENMENKVNKYKNIV